MKKKEQKRRDPKWLLLGLLVVLGVIAYWNSFGVPFVFDDLLSIQRNPGVRLGEYNWSLSARTVLYLTFTLNFKYSGQEVWGYHMVNLLLHLLNGVLIYFIALATFKRFDPDVRQCSVYSLLAAAFFVLHPIQTESVTYISSRSELLSTAFYLIAFLTFIRWPEQKIGFLLSVITAIPFFFGLGSKETVISLPATLFLYDFLILSHAELKPILQRWTFYATYLVGGVGAAYYILTVALKDSVGSNLEGHLPWQHYFLTQLRVVTRYVGLVFLPIGQNLDYDLRPSTNPFEPMVIVCALFLLAILAVGWLLRKREPIVAFSVFWFFLTLAPTSSIVPILDVIFEHRIYLPLVGVCLSFPLFARAVASAVRKQFDFQLQPNAIASLLIGVLLIGTVMRNKVWASDVTLYEDIVAKSPGKERVYTGLVWTLYKKGEYERAIDVMKKGIKTLPDKKLAFADTLGNLYLKTQRYDDAIELFKETIDNPEQRHKPVAYNNLGVAYLYKWNKLRAQQAQTSQPEFASKRDELLHHASDSFQKSIELDPKFVDALDPYINVNFDLGRSGDIEAQALAKLEKEPDFNSNYIVGKIAFQRALSASGDASAEVEWAKADEYFERAEKIRDNVKLIYFNHGYVLDKRKQFDRAIEKYTMAIRVDPIFIEAHHNVALILRERGRLDEAIEHFSEVLRYDPNHELANLNLAEVYAQKGDKDAARRYLTTVLTATPNNQRAMDTWKRLGL